MTLSVCLRLDLLQLMTLRSYKQISGALRQSYPVYNNMINAWTA